MRWPEGFMSLLVACRKGNGHIDKKYMSIQFRSTRADLDPIDANEKTAAMRERDESDLFLPVTFMIIRRSMRSLLGTDLRNEN
jgi:hypothetical protein